MTPAERRERYASLAWLTDPDAWAAVDAALWYRCAGHMLPVERDRMNLEIRQNLRAHGAYSAPLSPTVPVPALTVFGVPVETVVEEFIGTRCGVCNHELLGHRSATGCSIPNCGCDRRPGDFR